MSEYEVHDDRGMCGQGLTRKGSLNYARQRSRIRGTAAVWRDGKLVARYHLGKPAYPLDDAARHLRRAEAALVVAGLGMLVALLAWVAGAPPW